LREEIETILEGELGDPRIGLVNVSEVHLAADSRSARVMVVVSGDDKEVQQTATYAANWRNASICGELPSCSLSSIVRNSMRLASRNS
jgi:ribosome-binding factor A